MNIKDKIFNGVATLADQEDVLKDQWTAYKFALLKIPGTDIEKCQLVACKEPYYAYYFARNISEANIEYCQEHACKMPSYAYCFAYTPGADIKFCQEHACKEPMYAYCFARDIPGADIEYCRKACESDSGWLKEFDKMIAEKILL